MKSRIVFVLIIAMSLSAVTFGKISTPSFGTTSSTVRIFAPANSKTIMVKILSDLNDNVEIELEDAEGHVLYSETAEKTKSFSKHLNLVNLEAGFYTLIVKKNLVKTIQPFELTETAIKMSDEERKEKYLPNISQKGKKVDINVLLNKFSDIKVRIYDFEGRLVFEQISKQVQDLHKRFDLEKLESGAYLVEVVAEDETQYSTIKL